MRAILLAATAAASSGCASPSDRMETVELRPVPRSADVAMAAGGSASPVLPSGQVAAADRLLASVRSRGEATLADCFRFAEATQEDLLSGDEDRLQALLAGDAARANMMPTVNLTGTAFRQDRVPNSGGGSTSTNAGRSSIASSADREEVVATLRQPIFQGFRYLATIEAAELTADSKAARVEVIRSALRRSVARAFFLVLESEAEVRTLADSEKLDRTRVDEMRARQENGVARRTEVLLLESQLQRTLADLQRAETRRDVARTALDQLVGVEVRVPLVHADPPRMQVPLRGAAIAEALRQRPEIRAAGLATEAAEVAIRIARAGYLPTISFIGNEYIARAGFSEQAKATNWDVELEIDVPVFDGGVTRARERIARSQLRQSRLAESATLRAVVQDVESILARVATDAALLATFETNAALARENVGLLIEEYANGVATNLEVLTAQNVLQNAQLDVERQRLLNRLDEVELSIALGRTETAR
jgi:outer membrane protein TolC